MKVKLLDEVLEREGLKLKKRYEVVRQEVEKGDLYYVVINEKGKEVVVHELLAEEI